MLRALLVKVEVELLSCRGARPVYENLNAFVDQRVTGRVEAARRKDQGCPQQIEFIPAEAALRIRPARDCLLMDNIERIQKPIDALVGCLQVFARPPDLWASIGGR